MLEAIIVDDEQHCINRLQKQLEAEAPDIEIIACCKTVENAQQIIAENSPDILFLDVQLGNQTGFDLLATMKKIEFEITI